MPGTGWTAVEPIPTTATFATFGSPTVAIDDAGDALIVWNAADGVRAIVNARTSGWGADVPVGGAGSANGLRVAVGPGGIAMAMWTEYVGSDGSLVASRFVPGTGWSAPAPLDSNAGVFGLGFDAAGNALAAWTRYADPDYQTWVARHDGTAWDAAVQLDPADTSALPGDLAVAASGDAALTWEAFVPTGDGGQMPRVLLASFAPASGWTAGEIQPVDVSAFGESVEITDDGVALAVWHEFVGTPDTGFTTDIHARRFVPDTGWGTAYTLLEGARDPVLDMNATGDAVMAWTSPTAMGNQLNACALE